VTAACQLSLGGDAARAGTAAPALPLRPYQREALEAIGKAEQRGISRPLVALPTGSGKTVLFGHLLNGRDGRGLVLAHRDELIGQAVGKLRQIAPGLEVGVVKAERDETGADVVVASIQTLARPSRLARLEPNFRTIVVDECHHASAATYVAVLRELGAFTEGGPLTVGVTATPERSDKAKLGAVWQEIVYQRSMLEMIAVGYLVDLRAIQVGTDADLGRLHVVHGDLQDAEIADELIASGAIPQVAGAYLKHARDRKGIAFTPTVRVAYLLAQELAARGIAAEALDGTTPTDERRAILGRLHTGSTQVVVNCGVLLEGFDEPSVDCILIGRPTKSRPMFQQMIGRGTRPHPGKEDCLILDLAGVAGRHDLANVAELAQIDPAELEGRTITEALASRQARERDEDEPESEQEDHGLRLPTVTAVVPLFRSQMHWLKVAREYVLSIGSYTDRGGQDWGQGHIHLVPTLGDTWRVEGRRRNRPTKVLAEGLSLEYAQGLGEDIARRFGGTVARADAPWRSKPAKPAQLEALRRWHVNIPDGAELTRGQAADLLTQAAAKARKGRR
jgi:superfamily II DNA or RNA helicase